MSDLPPSQFAELEIALRAYAEPKAKPANFGVPDIGPSQWTLIFDCETTVDAAQALRFGVYQIRKESELWEAGFFVNSEVSTNSEISRSRTFAAEIGFKFMTVGEFVERVFFEIGYELRATIVGFNLPFDISRLAIRHGKSRGPVMKGGFSFQLSPHKFRPNVQIKHLSARASFIRFTTRPGRIAGRGMRRRQPKLPPRPGYFIDLKTLAGALTARSFNLALLAEFLATNSRKLGTDQHGAPITSEYLRYAVQDVQVTWECYLKLLDKFAQHKLTATLPHRIFSEASIGKTYFREMNIRPWREVQPDFPPDLIGIILSSYFGGRSEVHHRRMISRVCYCDFLSMYPTVCTLMGLWRFVIGNGINFRDGTTEIIELVDSISLRGLQVPATWPKLTGLVQVTPDADIFPIRAKYGGPESQYTIGLNYLYDDRNAFWFTLADCIASKLLTGKPPKILKALIFEPDGVQRDLRPIEIAGNGEYRIDPYFDDFYRRLIDLRSTAKTKRDKTSGTDRLQFDSEQQILKIIANASSYGNFVELNVDDLQNDKAVNCYGYSGSAFSCVTTKIEEPGPYFHPLIATLITGAARLMLAISERLAVDQGLDWAFCDTDSMAFAKPENMSKALFSAKATEIRAWFDLLNPYEVKSPLLKLEDANFALKNGSASKQFAPLYCLAISAKRYVLFNRADDGRFVIRKASAHGLGHLIAPYGPSDAPTSIPNLVGSPDEIGVSQWQHDLWHQIIRAVLEGCSAEIEFSYHPNLRLPAASHYAATTPALLNWFRIHNKERPYSAQVRPNNFMVSFQIDRIRYYQGDEFLDRLKEEIEFDDIPKPIAPFSKIIKTAARNCFDRETGEPIPVNLLKTYAEVLAQYHLRPENKFENGEYTHLGITRRRHVCPSTIRHIGKEANRWEKQATLGIDPEEQIDYGISVDQLPLLQNKLREKCHEIGQRRLATKLGISRTTLSKWLRQTPAQWSAKTTRQLLAAGL